MKDRVDDPTDQHEELTRRWTSTRIESRHPKIPIRLSQGAKHDLEIEAMIDSGSAITTISPELVQELGLNTTPNTGAHVIRNADGTLNKDGWQEDVEARVNTGVTNGIIRLAVVTTAGDRCLLGSDWMNRYGVRIDCSDGAVSLGNRTIYMIGTDHLRRSQDVIIA